MDALLDTLAKGRMRAGVRKGLAVAGVVVLLGAGAEARRRWDVAQRTAACEATGDEIAAVWSPAREQALREALVATKASFAPMTADRVTQWLARQAETWREARAEACLDADVRGRWDADTLDRSLWCLDARRMELESLVDELAHADAQVVTKAVKAAATLAPVAACRDEHALATMPPPPAADREALRAIRGEVIRAGNLERAGRYDDGLALARGALARAEALAWPPLVAEARLRLGWLLERKGRFAEAEAELERAYFDAGKGVAPEVVLEAALGLVRTVGLDAARYVEGRRWARLADMALEGLPDGEELRRAQLSSALANVEHAAGSFDAARQLHEQALALQQAALGEEHPSVATSLYNLANTDYATGRFGVAEQRYEQAIAISEAALGPEHPDVANILNNLAAARHATGAYEDVAALHTRALAIREKALGPRHPDVAVSLSNLAAVRTATGNHEEAAALLERANSIREQALGPEHPDLAQSLANLGIVYESTGDLAQAKTLHERALAIHSKVLGPEHPHVALDLNNLASVAHGTGDLAEAERLYIQAITRWEAALGPEHPNLSNSLMGLAEVRLAQHRPAEALPPASRAVTIREQAGVAVEDLAQARFVLAQVLWDAPEDGGRDRARALTLAEQARAVLRDAGEAEAEFLREVEAWLADHAREDVARPQ
jgi:tetratricopeptide (TPR) repeat protein